jgi:dihydroneopterin aldolase/D-erythro-7,8-dihydroneopterin triphosphate epimerase
MPDLIEIRGLLLRTIIGINPDERTNRQDVLIDLVLSVDTRPAARTDDIADAVNYRTLTKNVIAFVEASQFQLLETLTERVAALCLEDRRVQKVKVTVCKPGAIRFANSVGITIERTQG